MNFASKIYWGVAMAFLPLVFKPNLVNSPFLQVNFCSNPLSIFFYTDIYDQEFLADSYK